MAFRRRFSKRRRKPVEWLRTSTPFQPTTPIVANLCNFVLPYDGTNTQEVNVSNIIIGDAPYVTDSLIEERKTYTIDRIVGRIEVNLVGNFDSGTGGTYSPPGPLVWKWGIFVCDVDDSGAPLDLDVFDLFTTRGEESSWLHRDGMVLGFGGTNASISAGYGVAMGSAVCFPQDNLSRAPWGMVDVRVKRHINQDQRLFMMHAVEGATGSWNYGTYPANLVCWQALRVLAHWTGK